MKSAIESFIEFLDQQGWSYHQAANKPVLHFGFDGDNGKWHCAAIADSEVQSLVMMSFLPCRVTAASLRPACAELLTRINYDLTHGCFEMNFENGEIRFRTSLPLEDNDPAPEAIKHLVFSNLYIVDRFFGPIMAVVYGNVAPKAALASPVPAPAETPRFELN